MKSIDIFIAHETPFTQLGGDVGGAAAVAKAHAKGLSKIGFSTRIICPEPMLKQNSDYSQTTFFSKPESENNYDLYLKYSKKNWLEFFFSIFDKKDQIIYAHYFVSGGIICRLKERLQKPKFVYMGHSWEGTSSLYGNRVLDEDRFAVEAEILKKADYILVPTYAEKEILPNIYSKTVDKISLESKIKVIQLGVDKEIFNPVNISLLRKNIEIPYYLKNLKIVFVSLY